MVSKNVLPLPGKCRNMFFGLKTRQKGRQGTRHDDNWKNKWKKTEGKRLLAHAGKVRRKTDQGNRAKLMRALPNGVALSDGTE